MTGPFEVEVKIPIEKSDIENIRLALRKLGAERLNSETQIDHYYDHPCKKFGDTDESLRMRIRLPSEGPTDMTGHNLIEITYKGPKVDPLSKTRKETNMCVTSGEDAMQLLEDLGFRFVATLEKKRTFYNVGDITLSTDSVVGIGDFVEMEKIVDNSTEIEVTRDEIFDLVKKLGIDPDSSVRTSYLEMFIDQRE